MLILALILLALSLSPLPHGHEALQSLRKVSAARPPPRVHLLTLFGLSTPAPSQLPLYLNYWAESCGRNAAYIDCTLFVVVSDALFVQYARWAPPQFFACRPHDDELHANVRLELLNNSEWVMRATAQTGLAVVYGTDRMLKLADYKPLLGHIFGPFDPTPGISSTAAQWTADSWGARFKNHLPDRYSHWGFADPDIILGDLSRFHQPSHDAWTSYFRGGWQETTTAGQLLILRNSPDFRKLWHNVEETNEWALGALMNPNRVTYSEKLFGQQVFAYAALRNISFYHKLVSFTDERGFRVGGVYGRFFDYWYEDGRVYGRRACNDASMRPYPENQDETYHVEGALLHVWAMKKWLSDPTNAWQNKNQTMFSCHVWDFPNPTPWHDNRWNYSFVTRGGQEFVKASFHDPYWRSQGDFPMGSCAREAANARAWGT
jgi:hypothetical protein